MGLAHFFGAYLGHTRAILVKTKSGAHTRRKLHSPT